MIQGLVNDFDEANIELRLRGPNGVWKNVSAIIDTGFTGSLAIPLSIVTDLALTDCGESSMFMADGSMGFFKVYSIDIEWDGSIRNVFASALSDECLLGMPFLVGYQLTIQVKPRGRVQIEKLS